MTKTPQCSSYCLKRGDKEEEPRALGAVMRPRALRELSASLMTNASRSGRSRMACRTRGGPPVLGNKTGFAPRDPAAPFAPCPPPRLGRRRARVRIRRYRWTIQAARPPRTVAVFHHLRADASYIFSDEYGFMRCKRRYRLRAFSATQAFRGRARVLSLTLYFMPRADCSGTKQANATSHKLKP